MIDGVVYKKGTALPLLTLQLIKFKNLKKKQEQIIFYELSVD